MDRISTEQVLSEVSTERQRQERKWGRQDHDPLGWLAILVEEVGEVAQTICKMGVEPIDRSRLKTDHWRHEYRAELKQVAAVAVAAIESLDRNGIREGT